MSYPTFQLSSHAGGFCIVEQHASDNKIEVKDGELSKTQVMAIAYKLLAMTEGAQNRVK